MSWSDAEVELILEQMRLGETAQSGGSRCHTTYFFRAGQWRCEAFDEGHTDEYGSSEADIRGLIAREPELFRPMLRAVPWRRFSAAFLAGERADARARLRDAIVYGDPFDHAVVLDAVLQWPEVSPSEEVVALIREKLRDFTAYHVFMDAIGWDRSPETAEKGLAFVDDVVAMVGEAMGCHYLRSAFHEQAGDLEAAEREMVRELELCPRDASNRSSYEDSLARIRARMSG
jgi:hypothetical protein